MKAWEQFLLKLEGEWGQEVVDQWLRPLKVLRFDAGNLYLRADTPVTVAWFEEHITPRLKRREFCNENHRPIKVHLQGAEGPRSSPLPTPLKLAFSSDPIDSSYSLENFLVFPGNEVVFHLLQEVAAKHVSAFNPIFLYGPAGSGKTHLLMGLASLLKKRFLFVSAATFTEHVVHAIRSQHMQSFRKIYRDIDLLLIDNVDQFAKRTATQEEFFHTFNTLHTMGKQIVLTSSKPPSKLEEIEPRLISRFEWGISVPLEKGDPASILKQKALEWKFPLNEEWSHFFLEKFPSQPLIALQALLVRTSDLTSLSTQVAEKRLQDLLIKEKERSLTPEKIVKALSSHYGIKPEDIVGKSQAREAALPRQIGMFICRKELQMPFAAIGEWFGKRDHSTVMSSVKQVEKSVEEKNGEILEAIEIASRLE